MERFDHPWPELDPWEELGRLLALLNLNLLGIKEAPACVRGLATANIERAGELLYSVMQVSPNLALLQTLLTAHPEIVAAGAQIERRFRGVLGPHLKQP